MLYYACSSRDIVSEISEPCRECFNSRRFELKAWRHIRSEMTSQGATYGALRMAVQGAKRDRGSLMEAVRLSEELLANAKLDS